MSWRKSSHIGRVRLAVAVLLFSGHTLLGEEGDAEPHSNPRPRVREAGITVGTLPPGKRNAITDVAGVKVGHLTLAQGTGIRTGVTVVLPHDGNIFQKKVPAAIVVGNGFGKLIGITQVQELGLLETPIALTNTLNSFKVADGLVSYVLNLPENEDVRSVNPVVGECNDGELNDIRLRSLEAQHVHKAIQNASDGPVEEGSVGAGTGTICLGWKGGIGTASRRLPDSLGCFTVGVLVQTNFEGDLTIANAPVGRELGRYFLKRGLDKPKQVEHGSCMIVVATDAPLDSRQLRRLATRALLGLARVGSPMTHGSGDYVIAFSTASSLRSSYTSGEIEEDATRLRDDVLSPIFVAVVEATEEAVLNSLFKATTITGYRGHVAKALPIDRVVEICRKYGVFKE